MKQNPYSGFSLIFILTAALFTLTYFITGCFYETNDDVILTFLIKGVFIGQPVTDLTLYLHGVSSFVGALYQFLPSVPWYGIVLYSVLFGASLLAFWLVYSCLRSVLTPVKIYLILIFLYLSNWYEHVFWFNYSRAPILLAGVTALISCINQRQEQSPTLKKSLFCGSLFLLALCIRPSLAFFGFALVLPLFFLRHNSEITLKKSAVNLLSFVLVGLIFIAILYLKTTPEKTAYRRYDVLKSQILDYNWCCPAPKTQAAKLQYAGITQWFLADSNILSFLDQHSVDLQFFLESSVLPKFIQLFRYLLFDQFLALSLVLAFFIWYIKGKSKKEIQKFVAYHIYFWSLIIVTGVFFKIPPRILTPAVCIYLLTHLIWLPTTIEVISWGKWPMYARVLGLGLLVLQLYKINHRVAWQQQRQMQSEAVWAKIKNNYPEYLVLTAGLENELRALSPFKNYGFVNQRLMFATSWQTLDPYYAKKWQALSGQSYFGNALIKLSQQDKVVWVCNPEFMLFLKNYFKRFYHKSLQYTFIKLVSDPTSPEKLGFYQVKISN